MTSAPARILDLTRTVSRVGSGPPTGVDRVERAYLDRFLSDDVPAYGLVRIGSGFILLDRAGMYALLHGLSSGDGITTTQLRLLAIARGPLAAVLLRRCAPAGSDYFNVGHSNLSRWRLRMIRQWARCRITVLVHDVIPLQSPELSRRNIPARFARKMKAAALEADRIVCVSESALSDVTRAFSRFGSVPPAIVAPIGVDLARPEPARLPSRLTDGRPFFLCLGTIEPRKDHAFLLDLWDEMHRTRPVDRIPRLAIAGRRGWCNDQLFSRLDNLPRRGDTVLEFGDLDDGAVAALLDRATALLFPSRAEGFGLPPLEAAARGCPVLCLPLAVYRETLGDYPVYLKQGDRYSWLETMDGLIKADAQRGGTGQRQGKSRHPPEWQSHFNRVLSWSH